MRSARRDRLWKARRPGSPMTFWPLLTLAFVVALGGRPGLVDIQREGHGVEEFRLLDGFHQVGGDVEFLTPQLRWIYRF